MLSGIGSLAGPAAVVYAAWKAANKFDDWKRQKIAGRQFDYAERCLAATYMAREALDQIRSPLLHSVELQAAEAELKDDQKWPTVPEAERKKVITAQVYVRRIRQTEASWDELVSVLPLARALFDDDLEKALYGLLRLRWVLRISVDRYVDDDGSNGDQSIQIRRALNSKVEDGQDEISVGARQCITTIESKCIPALN